MNEALQVWVEGIGCWMPGLANWHAWQAWWRGDGSVDASAPAKPHPVRLAASERRRASVHVLAAIEVAGQALTMSGHDGDELPCIFASAHGDTGIMDYMCTVLARAPQELSPTRFHNSVHNAAAGYWTIASHSHAGSQAVAAGDATFAAALLDAAVQAQVERQPVLLVAHDDPGSGPLQEVFAITQAFACALVLSPRASARAIARLDLSLGATVIDDLPHHRESAQLARANPAGRALALLEALAMAQPERIALAAAPELGLRIDVHGVNRHPAETHA